MAHYLKDQQRREVLEAKIEKGYEFPKHEHRLIAFVNLAITPYDWSQIYASLRNREKISAKNWEAVKGVILALLVVNKRRNKTSYQATDAYTMDFIEMVRADSSGDPEKFLLNMKKYMYRFQLIVGLQVSFGINWRDFVVKTLELSYKPQTKTFSSLLTNKYVRNLVYAWIVWKNYKQPGEDGYELGTNDCNTLLDKYSSLYHSLPREKLQLLFVGLQETLPSYSYSIRRQAAYAIDNALDGWYTINHSWIEKSGKHNRKEEQNTADKV